MWNLKSEVKVSLDGRYEVAYRPGVLEEHLKLYGAKRGWQSVLTMYSTDAILVPCLSKLSSRMPTMKGWLRQYSDGVYEVYTRPGFAPELPATPVERVNFVARLFPNGLDRTEGWSSNATN